MGNNMAHLNLTESEKNEIIDLIKAGRPLPKEYIYKLYADDEDVFLFWNGRNETVTKQQSVIEEIAYRDTWGRGISSYLSMMYERLKLMHQLLAEDGSIYVHCDWRIQGEGHNVIGTFEQIMSSLEERKSKWAWLHNANIYDLILWFFIAPILFWNLHKLDSTMNKLLTPSAVLNAAVYVYLFVTMLWIYRIFFNAFRWVFPVLS